MGLLDSIIFGTALDVSGAFDKNRKTDKAAAFGVALGASIGSGKKWTMADSIRLGASINALDRNVELMWQFAYEISLEFFYKKGFQVVFAIHYDMQGKYHIHLAVNTVNYITGKKLQTFKKDIKEREASCNVILKKYLNLHKTGARGKEPFYFGIYKGEIVE